MKKLSIFAVAAFACLCFIGVMSGEVFADGDETLGSPTITISPGSGIVAAGVGMVNKSSSSSQADWAGDISVYVPHGAEIQQVLLYWEGRGAPSANNIEVRKRLPEEAGWILLSATNPVTDRVLIGQAFSANSYAYRADVTNLTLVEPGHSRFSVKGLDFSTNNDGAGVIVIFQEGSGEAQVQLVDGNDFAYAGFSASDLKTTVAQEFEFASSSIDRIATLSMHFSSVAGTISGGNFRTSSIRVTFDESTGNLTEQTIFYDNLLNSWDVEEWDSLNIDIVIPAGVTSLTVEPISPPDDICPPITPWAASFNWIVAALSVPEPEECGPCKGKITELTLKYTGDTTAFIEVFQKKDSILIFNEYVGPGGEFTFYGQDKKGTMGTEIIILVNGEENTKIHTSCSKPIGPGLISGDFVVIEGYSLDGGLLCPTDEDDDCECDGKVTWLTLQYNGPTATIKVVQKKDSVEIFEDIVQPDELFTFYGEDKNGTMGTEIIIYVDDVENTKIHTSCSQPIGPGLISGDFLVIEGESLKGGPLCPM